MAMPKISADRVIMFSVVGLVAWAIIGLPLFDSLQAHPPHNHEDNWYSTFLDHAPDWFVAIFTGLLVYVTYRLVKSTNKLWEAGERQMQLTGQIAAQQSLETREQIFATGRMADAAMLSARA